MQAEHSIIMTKLAAMVTDTEESVYRLEQTLNATLHNGERRSELHIRLTQRRRELAYWQDIYEWARQHRTPYVERPAPTPADAVPGPVVHVQNGGTRPVPGSPEAEGTPGPAGSSPLPQREAGASLDAFGHGEFASAAPARKDNTEFPLPLPEKWRTGQIPPPPYASEFTYADHEKPREHPQH